MRDIGNGDKSASSGRTHSRESAHKHKEESSSSIKSQRKGDKKKKMKKVVYYETDSSSPSTSGSESASATSKRHERKKGPFRLPEIMTRMCQYGLEPKRMRMVYPLSLIHISVVPSINGWTGNESTKISPVMRRVHLSQRKVHTGNISGFLKMRRDRKSTRLNSSHITRSRMPSSA